MKPTAAPAYWPYRDHRKMDRVMEVENSPFADDLLGPWVMLKIAGRVR